MHWQQRRRLSRSLQYGIRKNFLEVRDFTLRCFRFSHAPPLEQAQMKVEVHQNMDGCRPERWLTNEAFLGSNMGWAGFHIPICGLVRFSGVHALNIEQEGSNAFYFRLP
ncbi:hypothetical protein D3C83_17000 [compost metagenome]